MQDYSKNNADSLRALFAKAFIEHPRAAGESYWQHLLFTLGMAGRLGLCSLALIAHGLFPFTFLHTTSNKMKAVNSILRARADKTMEVVPDNWTI